MGTSHILTLEPQYLKIVLSTGFEHYEKGEVFRDVFRSLFGTGVFNSDGEMWKFHRSITRPFFTRDRISDFEIFDRHADLVIFKLKERFSQGFAVNVQDLLSRYTMDTATEFLFGQDVKSLSGELPYPSTYKGCTPPHVHPSDKFTSAFNRAQEYSYPHGFFAKAWRLVEFWEDKVAIQREITNEFIDPLIHTALRKKRDAKEVYEVDKDDGTLLDHLVQQTDDFDVIRDEALNILLAGRDTTAALTTFVVTMLAEHPDFLARLRKDVLDTLGPNGKVNPENLREMKYLRAVLNETLRLYPSVPWNVRCSKNSVVWPALDGGKQIYIPGRTQIHYLPWLMHRRKDLWGPDAEEFDPDRFLDERVKKYLVPNPFIFLPFNAGPRICLGQQFAYNEMSTIIARLVQAFKEISLDMNSNPEAKPPAAWALGPGRRAVEKVWVKSDITAYANGGVWVKMQEADME
ncbi:cytochrome P450 [Thelephora ganbajun]|uniref:Cytochrome P450 n=1 Tax=Thelephora ganbajun TaxID=370292 RepID=A0ACB6Z2X9_THEGA|nr:cytochrome P450 [Thelephora ganbajun]